MDRATISYIIDQNSYRWDTERIQRLFPPWIGCKILKLFLPSEPSIDTQIWEPEARGTYTVRKGYRVFKQQERTEDGELSEANIWNPLWRKIWSLHVPMKLKVLHGELHGIACRLDRSYCIKKFLRMQDAPSITCTMKICSMHSIPALSQVQCGTCTHRFIGKTKTGYRFMI